MQAHNATVRTPSALGAAPNALGRAPIVLGRGSYCIRKAPNVLLQNVLGRAPNACASHSTQKFWKDILEIDSIATSVMVSDAIALMCSHWRVKAKRNLRRLAALRRKKSLKSIAL